MSEPAPVVHFIFAAPFSGARRLMHALNRHPDICGTEFQLFGAFFDPRPRSLQGQAPRITFDKYLQAFANHFPFKAFGWERNEFLQEYLREYLQFLLRFTARRTGKRILVDTIVPYPGTSRRIADAIAEHFPEAKIIYLRRDGRDVVTEATFDTLTHDGHGTDRYAYFVENRPHVVLNRFFDDHALSTWATNWSEAIAVEPRLGEQTLHVEYEELERDPTDVVRRLLTHLELSSELPPSLRKLTPGQLTDRASTRHVKENFLRHHAHEFAGDDFARATRDGGAASASTEAIPRRCSWRMFFTQQDGRLFQEMAGRQLRRAGYESTEQWLETLPPRLALQSV